MSHFFYQKRVILRSQCNLFWCGGFMSDIDDLSSYVLQKFFGLGFPDGLKNAVIGDPTLLQKILGHQMMKFFRNGVSPEQMLYEIQDALVAAQLSGGNGI